MVISSLVAGEPCGLTTRAQRFSCKRTTSGKECSPLSSLNAPLRAFPNDLYCRPELGQTELFADILPTDVYGHFATHRSRIAANNIGKEMGPFFELDDCDHVGEISFKSGMKGLMVDNEAEDRSLAAGAYPLHLLRVTQRA